jgi:hypothetical protein
MQVLMTVSKYSQDGMQFHPDSARKWSSNMHWLYVEWFLIFLSTFCRYYYYYYYLFFYYILYAKCLKFSLYLTEEVSLLQGLKGDNLRVV